MASHLVSVLSIASSGAYEWPSSVLCSDLRIKGFGNSMHGTANTAIVTRMVCACDVHRYFNPQPAGFPSSSTPDTALYSPASRRRSPVLSAFYLKRPDWRIHRDQRVRTARSQPGCMHARQTLRSKPTRSKMDSVGPLGIQRSSQRIQTTSARVMRSRRAALPPGLTPFVGGYVRTCICVPARWLAPDIAAYLRARP